MMSDEQDWKQLLADAIAASDRAAVGRQLGVTRGAVSMLASGKYPADTRHMEKRILERYGKKSCLFTGRPVSAAECRETAFTMPTSSPAALRLWKACQTCPYNLKYKGE